MTVDRENRGRPAFQARSAFLFHSILIPPPGRRGLDPAADLAVLLRLIRQAFPASSDLDAASLFGAGLPAQSFNQSLQPVDLGFHCPKLFLKLQHLIADDRQINRTAPLVHNGRIIRGHSKTPLSTDGRDSDPSRGFMEASAMTQPSPRTSGNTRPFSIHQGLTGPFTSRRPVLRPALAAGLIAAIFACLVCVLKGAF